MKQENESMYSMFRPIAEQFGTFTADSMLVMVEGFVHRSMFHCQTILQEGHSGSGDLLYENTMERIKKAQGHLESAARVMKAIQEAYRDKDK